jgi:hypothetical protein
LETFTELKGFVDNPNYHEQRKQSLAKLDMDTIDAPIVDIVSNFANLSHCFTLQSCYGHFLYGLQKDLYNIDPLPVLDSIRTVEYRIAYIALCLENSHSGMWLFKSLERLPAIAPEHIQFGCAEWFWERQINSYTLQVQPKKHMTKDKVFLDYDEALYIEKVRGLFFDQLKKLLQEQLDRQSRQVKSIP